MSNDGMRPRDKDFTYFDRPIGDVGGAVRKAVEALPASRESVVIDAILASIADSYRAICILNADARKEHFAADSATIARGMLETYFSLLLWLQNPSEHSVWYWKSAWLDDRAESELDETLRQYDPALQERIDARRQARGYLVRAADLRQVEIDGTVNIERWPATPGKMLKQTARWQDEATRQQAERLYGLLYPALSRRAHPTWLALAERFAYHEAKKRKDKPAGLERALRMASSAAVFSALLITVMVMTELNRQVRAGQEDALRQIWRSLIEFRPHAGAYYEARFKALLGPL